MATVPGTFDDLSDFLFRVVGHIRIDFLSLEEVAVYQFVAHVHPFLELVGSIFVVLAVFSVWSRKGSSIAFVGVVKHPVPNSTFARVVQFTRETVEFTFFNASLAE